MSYIRYLTYFLYLQQIYQYRNFILLMSLVIFADRKGLTTSAIHNKKMIIPNSGTSTYTIWLTFKMYQTVFLRKLTSCLFQIDPCPIQISVVRLTTDSYLIFHNTNKIEGIKTMNVTRFGMSSYLSQNHRFPGWHIDRNWTGKLSRWKVDCFTVPECVIE